MRRIEIKVGENVYFPTNPKNCSQDFWFAVSRETWDKIDNVCQFLIFNPLTNLK